jgi:transposase
MEDSKRVNRRRHAADLEAASVGGVRRARGVVAQVALAHGLNANLVHKWRRMVDEGGVASKAGDQQAEFVSLTLAPDSTVVNDIHLELRRGAIAVNVTWPLSASGQCAALTARALQVIRVDALWLAVESLDMTSSSGYRRSRQVGSQSCCRIIGRHRRLADLLLQARAAR